MTGPSIKILVVDDYEPWRGFVIGTLCKQAEFQIIGQVSDGLQAVDRAQQLQPDLILLDIGLPTLNGIEAARKIHELAPQSKILFLSENRSLDVAEEALSAGACGYVIKSYAAVELLPAIEAVLAGKRFVSTSLCVAGLIESASPQIVVARPGNDAVTTTASNRAGIARHQVGFYSDDRTFIDGVTRFIGAALTAGSGAIVIATPLHQDILLTGLHSDGLNIGQEIEQGRYIAVNATDIISTLTVDHTLDTARFLDAIGQLVLRAAKAANTEHAPVAMFGEGAQLLCAQGNVEAAIQDEKLCNELIKMYDVDILCGYAVDSLPGRAEHNVFERICAEHSVVHNW